MQRSWMAVCAIGLVASAALFLDSVLGASMFMRTAEDLTVEHVRRDLQSYLDEYSFRYNRRDQGNLIFKSILEQVSERAK